MLKDIIAFEDLPVLQNRVFDTANDAVNCMKGAVNLVQDQETGLVFNSEFNPSLVIYDKNYDNEQSFSPAFHKHLSEVLKLVCTKMGSNDLFEVGCGKGYFLNMLLNAGCDVSGCDPTYVGNSPYVIKEFFTSKLGLADKNLILRHVLEHIPNPFDFLAMLRDVNKGGKIYIEVPCFEWILRNNAWFDLFYEHVNYFRLSDFKRLFGNILDCGTLFGGQYIYVIADLASLQIPVFDGKTIDVAEQFGPRFQLHEQCQDTVVWGAASKGVVYAIHSLRAGNPISAAVDINPAKQGKFLPVSGIPVISPEMFSNTFPSTTQVVIANSNYEREIKEMSNNRYCYLTIEGTL